VSTRGSVSVSVEELVLRCLRYRITGALIYGPSRIGKTRAIEYLRLFLAETHPKMTTYHAQAEHKPRHAEGPFFTNLLEVRVDEEVSPLIPHRPERAQLTHSVLRCTGSLTDQRSCE